MKILIDCVYTGRASTCSTSYLAWKIIERLIGWRDDVFFYLMVPPQALANEQDSDFVHRHADRVRLVEYPYLPSDRVEELFKHNDRMIQLLSPGDTPIWDYDVVLTSRIPQLPFMRNVSGREANFPKGTERLFVGLEEMPVFSFRDTVAWAAGGNMDLQSLAAYESAGAIVINNLWTKAQVDKVARRWLSPSRVKELQASMHEAVPVRLARLAMCPKPMSKTLNVVFCGRMTGTRNFKEVAELFRKQFSYPLGKNGVELRFIVSTNSQSTGSTNVGDISFVEVQKNNREQFHKLLSTEAHVVVNLSTVEDFSLSTYEPLLLGVPTIVPRNPWADFLGADYPFRAKNFTEAYALLKEFAVDYDAQYTRFNQWEGEYWKTFVKSTANVDTAEVVRALVMDHEAMVHARLAKSAGGRIYHEIRDACLAMDKDHVDVLAKAHEMEFFLTNAAQWRGIPVGKRPNAHLLKVWMNMAGWKDTNAVGVMRRPAPGEA